MDQDYFLFCIQKKVLSLDYSKLRQEWDRKKVYFYMKAQIIIQQVLFMPFPKNINITVNCDRTFFSGYVYFFALIDCSKE